MARRISFYLDEHIARAVAHGLRQRGIDVQTPAEAGLLGATDREHLQYAHRQNRVLVTQDADFPRLHAEGADHTGITYVSHGTSISDTIRGLVLIHEILAPEEMVGHLEFL